MEIVDDPAGASHILINTCGFIQDAKEESIAAILDACGNSGGGRVVVTGCLVERYPEELRRGIPEVAAWFGLCQMEALVDFLRDGDGDTHATSEGDRDGTPGSGRDRSYAYIKISDGCDEACSFCAIPGIKGGYYSVDPAEILAEARACVAEGARELVLVGQNTAAWCHGRLDLVGLLDLLAAEELVRRIRLMYLQPDHVTEELLYYMATQPKMCRYLDVPFQHADAQVLRRMGRRGDAEEYREILANARRVMPDVSVRSTFIVGFPGETAKQFETLLAFVSAAGFDHAGGFVYSPEEGTSAAKLGSRVRRSIARERLNRLTDLLGSQAELRHRGLVGSRVDVMMDSRDSEELDEGVAALGRTAGQAPEVDGVTYIEGELPQSLRLGDIVTVRLTNAMGYDLVASYDKA